MAELNTVATPISAASWAQDLQQIATRADALERDPDASLADRLDLATDAFSRLWLAWSPQVIARSCRASARLTEPVLLEPGPLDQQLAMNQQIRMRALLSAGQLERPAEIAPVLPDEDKPAPKMQRRNRRTMDRDRPAGWLSANEVAAASGCTSARVRHLMRTERIPAAMVNRVSLRGLWFDPEVVELLGAIKAERANIRCAAQGSADPQRGHA
jgi:hypothetical protein